jgi:hypothetical protein
MRLSHRWACILILLGFLDGRLTTYQGFNGLPFPPEIRVLGKGQGRQA